MYLDSNLLEMCYQFMIGLDNGLIEDKRQNIIWTNGTIVYWRTYASLGLESNQYDAA